MPFGCVAFTIAASIIHRGGIPDPEYVRQHREPRSVLRCSISSPLTRTEGDPRNPSDSAFSGVSTSVRTIDVPGARLPATSRVKAIVAAACGQPSKISTSISIGTFTLLAISVAGSSCLAGKTVFSKAGAVILPSQPQGDIYQPDERRHFHQRPNDRGKSSAMLDSNGCNSDRDSQFEIIGSSGKRQRRRLAIGGPDLLAHKEGNEKHQDEINKQRNRDADHVER